MPMATYEQMLKIANQRGSCVGRELNVLCLAEIKRAKKEEQVK